MDEKLPGASDILIYQAEDGSTRIDVKMADESVWLTQTGLAELYQTTKQNISLHLINVFEEGELERAATVKEYLTVRQEGVRKVQRKLEYYNLDAILAVGYRVKSHRGTQFRRWATERLKEYLVKGFVMDDERLKEGKNFGADYFDELLERIRDIRASEKRFYLKVRDIYALSADYDPKHPMTMEFFQTVQNKLHYAVHGHTAAELIKKRVDADKPNMGLTSWKGAKLRRQDVSVAKNYLSAEELSSLNRIVTMYLDYAEDQAERRTPVYMKDWREKLDAFLTFNGREVLANAGTVSAKVAEKLALEHYERFDAQRRANEALQGNDDFDRAVKKIEDKK